MIGVQLPDPERELIAILTAALGAGIASTDYPSTSLAVNVKRVQVDLEGGDVDDYPVTERAQVRVTCHVGKATASQRTVVKDLADDCRRHLVTNRTANVAGIVPLGGRSGVSTDPTTGNVMCWFLVRVDLKASLAS